ncbi:MAG: DUF6493 family protein, partial [Verrucomicrobiota bacterium]
PRNRFALFAQGIRQISRYLEMSPDRIYTETEITLMSFLEEPPHELGETGHLLLAMGLNSAFASTRKAVVDTAVANIEAGRIDPECFGAQIARMLQCGYARVRRLQPGLRALADFSPLHARVVGRALCCGLDLQDASPPGRFSQLLELLVELRCRHPDLPWAESVLATLKGLPDSGKTRGLKKKLLG